MLDLWLEPGSYLGIIVILALTGCGLPLPEEVPIIAAGVASKVGTLNPWMAFASCLIGALLGDSALYAIGYHFGRNLMNAHPRLARLLHAEREAKMEELINRYGMRVLFVARFMVVVCAPVYLSIGILRHPYRKFVLIDLFCATAVVGLFFSLSYRFGEHVHKLIRDGEVAFTVIIVAIVVTVALVLLFKRRRSSVGTESPESEDERANHKSGTLV